MQFQRIHVQNWRCFTDESVRFEDGVTVLYGNNGSGKSSLLEAAFFALYGTDALETGTNMDDVVTTDEDTAEVTLSFAHRGKSYEVTREIRIRASTTQSADLTTPPGQPDLNQISAIDELIEQELRLNAEDFLNSAYVQQGDVSRLIDATPKQRQRIIDNLLQMSKLERYRDRMDSIETGVSRVVETKEDQAAELNAQIEEYDETRIRSRKQLLHGFESELEDTRETINEEIDSMEDEKEDAEEVVSAQEGVQETVQETWDNVESQMESLATATADYQSLQTDLETADTEVEEHQTELGRLLSVGDINLATDFGAVEDLSDAITERASDIVTNGVDDVTANSRLPDSNSELRDVATSLIDELSDDTEEGIAHGTDAVLESLSTSVPPLTAAVSDGSPEADTTTIATTDAIDPADVDPMINPSAEINVSKVLVPNPGLEVEAASVELEVAEDAQDETRDIVSDIRGRLQDIESAAADARSEAERFIQDAQRHEREIDSALDGASAKLTEIANIRRGRTELTTQRNQLQKEIEASPFEIAPDHSAPHSALKTRLSVLEERITRLQAERDAFRERATKLDERIEQADQLLADGNCPECGRPVDGAPNVEHRDEWNEERDSAENMVEALEEGISELQGRQETAETLCETAQDLYGDDVTVSISGIDTTTAAIEVEPETDLTPLHEEAATHHLAAREERQAAQQKRLQSVIQHLTAAILTRSAERTLAHLTRALARQDLLSQIEAAVDHRTNAERDHELAKTKLDTQATKLTEAHTDLQAFMEEYSEATDSFDPEALEEAEETVERLENELDDLNDNLSNLRATEHAVAEHLGNLGQQLEQLSQLRDKRDTRQREATAVAALSSQITELEEMFVNLRADLREQNVQRLEDLLQEMFDTLYRNDAYADIKLDHDYDATLIEKGGGELPPTKLSGGESAIFNLALRGAIYRLLTEGFEDDVPMPPLILDEPTAHLDDGHVDRLNDVVEAMRTAGVKQTIVVSHDEGLIDSADHRIKVRQQQGTNRSVVEPETILPVEL